MKSILLGAIACMGIDLREVIDFCINETYEKYDRLKKIKLKQKKRKGLR